MTFVRLDPQAEGEKWIAGDKNDGLVEYLLHVEQFATEGLVVNHEHQADGCKDHVHRYLCLCAVWRIDEHTEDNVASYKEHWAVKTARLGLLSVGTKQLSVATKYHWVAFLDTSAEFSIGPDKVDWC